MYKRIIPRIDIKNNTLVKGISLEGLRVLGDPLNFIRKYYEDSADEFLIIDVVASLYGRQTIDNVINNCAKDVFVTINTGGGLRNIEDIDRMLSIGSDKVSLNSAAIKRPEFIRESVDKFGSSTISILIETNKIDGEYFAFYESGREKSKKKLFDWILEVQDMGAGEIVVIDIKNEGRQNGFDINLFEKIRKIVSVPLVASGGAGRIDDISEIFLECDVDGVCLASLLHYSNIEKVKDTKNKGNYNFIHNHEKRLNFSIKDIKKRLKEKNIRVR